MKLRLLLVAVTLLGVSTGWLTWMRYESTPGRFAEPPTRYPGNSSLPRILLFLHPYCPCSRATVSEFASLRHDLKGYAVEVVLNCHADLPYGAQLSDLRRRFPGCVIPDLTGEHTRRYGVWTSGQVVVYDAKGQLRFCGGITGGRGHLGDNPGLRQLRAALKGSPSPLEGQVFGCPIRDPDEFCGPAVE